MTLSDAEKVTAFTLSLQGAASRWLKTLSADKKTTWGQLKESYEDRFLAQASADVIKAIRARKQKPQESVEQFATEITGLMHRLKDYSEVERVLDFQAGLLPPIRRAVALQDPKNLEEALRYAKAAEKAVLNDPPGGPRVKTAAKDSTGEQSFNFAGQSYRGRSQYNYRGGANYQSDNYVPPLMPPRQNVNTPQRGRDQRFHGPNRGHPRRTGQGQQRPFPPPFPGSRENGLCFICGDSRHFARECPNRPGNVGREGPGLSTGH
jgi:hypothetical protein